VSKAIITVEIDTESCLGCKLFNNSFGFQDFCRYTNKQIKREGDHFVTTESGYRYFVMGNIYIQICDFTISDDGENR
jgi:hypothetical protein